MITKIEWREDPASGNLVPVLVSPDGKTKPVTWAPLPGSQELFLTSPVFETLYAGTRANGKSDCLIMDFAQDVGKFGQEWHGLIFRRTFPELEDIIGKAKKWFPLIWPDSEFHETKSQYQWATKEVLRFRHAKTEADYWSMHGRNVPFVGWDELTTWENQKLYLRMMSICRSTVRGIKHRYRATTNPFGVGHNWCRQRFELPVPSLRDVPKSDTYVAPKSRIGRIIKSPDTGQERVAIHGDLYENIVLLHSDPNYIGRLLEAAPNPEAMRAWVLADWDVVAGGMLDDVFEPAYHVVPPLIQTGTARPTVNIPDGWKIDRSYDHGDSKPFAVGWWAESDGHPTRVPVLDGRGCPIHDPITGQPQFKLIGEVKGDIVMIAEWYGWNGQPNEGLGLTADVIARGIRERQREWGVDTRCLPGPADNSIFDDYSPGRSVAGDMRRSPNNVRWRRSDKGPGSRKQGWQQIRKYLLALLPAEHSAWRLAAKHASMADPTLGLAPATYKTVNGVQTTVGRTMPGLFIASNCEQWLRTVPTLGRDDKDPDDVNTRTEDHCVVGDTLVCTPGGLVPIKDLPPEGTVLTLDGYRPYTNCRLTRKDAPVVRVTTVEGHELVCTPDHVLLCAEGMERAAYAFGLNWMRPGPKGIGYRYSDVMPVRPAGAADVYCLTVPSTGHFCVTEAALAIKNCGDFTRYRLRRPALGATSDDW